MVARNNFSNQDPFLAYARKMSDFFNTTSTVDFEEETDKHGIHPEVLKIQKNVFGCSLIEFQNKQRMEVTTDE